MSVKLWLMLAAVAASVGCALFDSSSPPIHETVEVTYDKATGECTVDPHEAAIYFVAQDKPTRVRWEVDGLPFLASARVQWKGESGAPDGQQDQFGTRKTLPLGRKIKSGPPRVPTARELGWTYDVYVKGSLCADPEIIWKD